MAKIVYKLFGVRGRVLDVYDTKCVIKTGKTLGSFLTDNFTDGVKTIFLCDIVGVQFKKSGVMIGYLQFETPSMQMNNKDSNFFSENTFTFQEGTNGITNQLMQEVYDYIVDRIEEIKYPHNKNTGNTSLQNTNVGNTSFTNQQNTNAEVTKQHTNMESSNSKESIQNSEKNSAEVFEKKETPSKKEAEMPVEPLPCPECGEDLSFMGWSDYELSHQHTCPFCRKKITFKMER